MMLRINTRDIDYEAVQRFAVTAYSNAIMADAYKRVGVVLSGKSTDDEVLRLAMFLGNTVCEQIETSLLDNLSAHLNLAVLEVEQAGESSDALQAMTITVIDELAARRKKSR